MGMVAVAVADRWRGLHVELDEDEVGSAAAADGVKGMPFVSNSDEKFIAMLQTLAASMRSKGVEGEAATELYVGGGASG